VIAGRRSAVVCSAWLLIAGGVAPTAGREAIPAVRFVREIPWAGHGSWIAADTHIHTTFSDGANSVAEVVKKAVEYGCKAVAITDHGDGNLKAATPEYAAAITAARTANPGLVVLAGLEWNIPPWAGDEHAAVLVPTGANEWKTLSEFKRRFDDYHRPDHDSLDALDALRWLNANGSEGGVRPVVVYNHPSRKDDKSIENVADIERWRSANDLVIGFEGGPGHQGKASPGDYVYKERTIDRWDPAVARIGDAWDVLLQRGMSLSGAYATSDFHSADGGDRWPCQFSETWLYVPDVSPSGILRALRAGAMFGVHGHIARSVDFRVEAAGLSRSAMAGESIGVPAGSSVTATLKLEVPSTDWEGQPNHIDQIELIAVTKDGAAVIATRVPGAAGEVLRQVVTVPSGGIVLRVRGWRLVPGGPSLMFYTNPIQIITG